jgi:hypothetical protein
MALLSAEHLAGPGYIILNVMRGLNIIALASVVASSVVMLVKTFIISKVCLPTICYHSESLQELVLLLRRMQSRYHGNCWPVPHRLRVLTLPQLLRSQLATPKSCTWFCYPRLCYDDHWPQHARKHEQSSDEPGVIGHAILAPARRLWNLVHCDWILQHRRRKSIHHTQPSLQ